MIKHSTLGTQLHVRIIIKSSRKIHNVLSTGICMLQDTFDNASLVNLNINHQHQNNYTRVCMELTDHNSEC